MEEKKELLDQDERVVEIELERLRGFVNHPFKVRADSQMIELQESIKKYGILNPLIVRPRQDGTYEIISVQRYIKITELIPEMLEKVDDGSMGFTPAVQLSFLKKKEQKEMLDAMEFAQCTPSLSQALRIKKLSADGKLTVRDMEDILSEIKQKEIDRVVFKTEQLHRFFPVSYTAEQMRREILEMLKLNMNKYWDE